jgi:bifunctional non-homologous end joining protein LigD
VFKDACKLGLEGVVSKVTTGKYRSGRRNEWVKVTCRKRDTFIVAGIAYKRGKFDGIYLAREKGKALEYAGKVENGFTDAAVKQLERRSVKLATRKSPLSKAIKKPKARWLKPRLLAEVEYRALTGAGKVRHPSFKGLREDLSAERIA